MNLTSDQSLRKGERPSTIAITTATTTILISRAY